MRVGIDTSPLLQTRAGTARYLEGLIGGLEELGEIELRRLAFGGSGRLSAVVRDTWWYLTRLPRVARRASLDVLHCPSFRAPIRSNVPLVVTVHDLAVLRHPEAFNRWTRSYSRRLVPRVVKAADRLIAVSEFTRRELVSFLGVPDAKIRVVPNAVGGVFSPEGPAAEGDYVLAVGTVEPRKNLARVVEAAKRAGVELRVVGERGWGDVELPGNGVRWLGRVPDDELASLYRGALCLAYPSLYEGFGIPVLEALASGTPVVTSAAGATEEVAGGAAVLVDPRDPASISAGIGEAVSRRAELSVLGPKRASRFSWRATVEATAGVYRELAG
ncbi:MAG: glycosyltransferase family 4 protein [Actinobacteria bacterium]|nr:glycosyltransferase family 4 protein [Actinomycetota bacterium]